MAAKIYDAYHHAHIEDEKDKADDFDYCLVLPADNNEQLSKEANECITILRLLEFEMFAYKALTDRDDGKTDEIFVLLRLPYKTIMEYADLINHPMLLDPEVLQKRVETGLEPNIKPFKIADRPDIVKYKPYEFIYGEFKITLPLELYWKEEGDKQPFRDYERLKLTSLKLESNPPGSYKALDLDKLQRNEIIKAIFPLKNRGKAKVLSKEWLDLHKLPWHAPFYHIREYFGEKIALYTVFLGHYSSWLRFPALVGIPFQLAIIITGNFSLSAIPAYSFMLAIWSVIMLEFWKRKQSRYALEWGSVNFESDELDRVEFEAEEIDSFINGKKVKYFPSKQRSQRLMSSYVIVITLILLVMGVLVSIYVIRFSLVTSGVSSTDAQTVASILNSVQIQITNAVYSYVVLKLTDLENHRTDTLYEDSLIVKVFMFQFINSYASFYYIAFVAKYFGDCSGQDCVISLAKNLGIILGSNLITANILEVILPYYKYKYKLSKELEEQKKSSIILSRPENEFLLDEYDHLVNSISNFSDLAIQYGYTAIFASALPAAAFFSLLSNIIQSKSDAWKLLNLFRRPDIVGASDIGTWQIIFYLVSVAAVITNAGITVFTQTVFDKYSSTLRVWIFVIFQWACFAIQIIFIVLIPDEEEEVTIQKKRTEYIHEKVIDLQPDEDIEIALPNDFEIKPLEYQVYPNSQLNK